MTLSPIFSKMLGKETFPLGFTILKMSSTLKKNSEKIFLRFYFHLLKKKWSTFLFRLLYLQLIFWIKIALMISLYWVLFLNIRCHIILKKNSLKISCCWEMKARPGSVGHFRVPDELRRRMFDQHWAYYQLRKKNFFLFSFLTLKCLYFSLIYLYNVKKGSNFNWCVLTLKF